MKNVIIALVGLVLIGGLVFFGTGKKGSDYKYQSGICKNSTELWSTCVSDYYTALVQKYGSQVATDDLKKRFDEDGNIAAQCHPIMHTIGAEASKSYKTVSEAFLHGDAFCWSGYYHGVMEGVIARIGEADLPKQLDTICAEIPGKESYNFDYFNCVHGLGHGIMELKGDELFDSLKMCDNLKGDWEQKSCQSGVFMENVIVYEHYGTSKYLKVSEPLYPCTAVEGKYKEQCYLGQTSFALRAYNYDFPKTFALCESVEEPWRDICMQSMGRDAGNQARHDGPTTKNMCYIPADQNDRNNCVVGAVKEFISYYHDIKQADDFCNLLGSEKALCLQTGRQYFTLF